MAFTHTFTGVVLCHILIAPLLYLKRVLSPFPITPVYPNVLSVRKKNPVDGRFCPCIPFYPLDAVGPQAAALGLPHVRGARVVGVSPPRYYFLYEGAVTSAPLPPIQNQRAT